MKPIDSSRLDVAVASLFNISRSQAQKAIKNGGVSVDSKVITSLLPLLSLQKWTLYSLL